MFRNSIGSIVVTLSLVGCIDALDLAGRPCPCVSGWTCDESTNQCVQGILPSGTKKGGRDATPDGDDPDGGIGDGGNPDLGICPNRFCLVHPRSQPELTDVWVRTANDVWAVGEEGQILHYNGASLRQVASPYTARYTSLWGIPGHLYAAGLVGNVIQQITGAWEAFPANPSATFSAVWADAPDNVYAVGLAGGRGFITRYNGTNWEFMTPALDVYAELYGIWGSASNDIYAVGDQGTMRHYDGYEWTETAAPTSSAIKRISGIDANNIVITTDHNIFRFNGSEWMPEPDPGFIIDDVWMRSVDEFYTISGHTNPYTGIYRHHLGSAEPMLWLGGHRFYGVRFNPLNRIRGLSTAADLFAVGKNGVVLHFNGAAWRELSYGSGPLFDGPYAGIWCRSVDEAWAVGEDGIIRYNGVGWRQIFAESMPIGDTVPLQYGVWGDVSSGNVFIVGWFEDSGTIWHYDRLIWRRTSSGSGSPLRAVWGKDDHHVIAVGDDGMALHFDGSSWQPYPGGTGTTRDLVSIWGTSMNNVYAVARDDLNEDAASEILHYDGSAWSPIPATQMAGLNAISGSGPNNIYAVGEDGLVLHFNGTSWRVLTLPTTAPLRAVWVGGARDVLVGGGDVTYLHFNGTSWRAIEGNAGSRPQAIAACSNNLFLVGGYHASLQSAGVLRMSR